MGARLDLCIVSAVPRISDKRGDIGVVEVGGVVPFSINRMYYSYNTPNNVSRGGHAHRALHQFMIAMAGSFDITLDDGIGKRTISLNQRENGLYICPMIWRDLSNFSPDAICLVLASEVYDEQDYIRDYDEFLATVGQQQRA